MLTFPQHLTYYLQGAIFMLSLILCIKVYPIRKNNQVVHFLFWLLVFSVFTRIKDLMDLFDQLWKNSYIMNISIMLDMFPISIAFFLKILAPKWITVKKIVLVFIPLALFLIGYIIFRYYFFYVAMSIYTNVLTVVSTYFILIGTSRYNRYIKNNFSNTQNLNVSWLRNITIISFAWDVLFSLYVHYHAESWWVDAAYYPFVIVIWAAIYYYSVRHSVITDVPNVFRPLAPVTPPATKEYAIVRDLKTYMDRERPWLNPTLTLNELSLAIGTNRTYLSAYLNNTLGITFYDYLNTFRINEACLLLTSLPIKTLEEVAEQSGFNSLSTFRRAFYKAKRVTPAQYRKNNNA